MRILRFIRDFFASKHIQLALVSGISILALAYVSKRVLPEPMDKLLVALPAFLVAIGEGVIGMKKKAWYVNANLWIATVALSTTLIILIYLAR
jgi:hypothetical protein